ncbi:response regulator transcription factor [Salimicrobium flavidum]|uniref:Heme response regulator HssR n=1 Tax=Salimicrobium flavidum TaxID=570947 RepID=A0A1N7JAB9_9BACI|nr:response regulator transcription factor [Salimicrobium flavidum]SIS46196.1 DNA-binding response regulator, OmpR family, contains REC and winged-helix (wHTH) domain [Salimicrobium flavidum]
MTSILITDDDSYIRKIVSHTLQQSGYRTFMAANAEEAQNILGETVIDLAIIDVMMPGMDGYSLTRTIRLNYGLPVILLTAKGELHDKELGYRAGTDDYIVKPFEPKELLFRTEAVLRRYDRPSMQTLIAGDMKIELSNYNVQIGDTHLMLPLKEFEILALLASRPNRVLSRDHLIEHVWGIDFEGDERTLNVHIKRLRERLSPLTSAVSIQTVRGVGYRLEVKEI